jgi:hypothetical protein
MGNDEDSTYDCQSSATSACNKERSPRGIPAFNLVGGGKFGTWKVQGKLGGYEKYDFYLLLVI